MNRHHSWISLTIWNKQSAEPKGAEPSAARCRRMRSYTTSSADRSRVPFRLCLPPELFPAEVSKDSRLLTGHIRVPETSPEHDEDLGESKVEKKFTIYCLSSRLTRM